MTSVKTKNKSLVEKLSVSLAFFCIGIGIISVISSNWDKISPLTKIISDFVLLSSLALGIYFAKTKEKNTLFEGLIIFQSLLILGSLGLFIQIYNLQPQIFDVCLTALILTFPLVICSKKMILGFFWIPTFLNTLAYYVATIPWMQNIAKYLLQAPLLYALFLTCVLIIFYQIGRYFLMNQIPGFIRAFKFWIVFNISANVIQADFWGHIYNWGETLRLIAPAEESYRYVPYILVVLAISTLYALCRKFKTSYIYPNLMSLSFVYTCLCIHSGTNSNLIGMIFTIGILILFGAYGYQNNSRKIIKTAAILIALRIFIGFIQVFDSLLSTGLGLIASGLILLALIYTYKYASTKTLTKMEKKNEK